MGRKEKDQTQGYTNSTKVHNSKGDPSNEDLVSTNSPAGATARAYSYLLDGWTMIPKSFSATAFQVAEGCLSRYKAEVIDRGANFQGTAANVGIVLHGTLEDFLRAVYIRKDEKWDWTFYDKLFHENYDKVFGAQRGAEYADALELARKWFYDPEQRDSLDCTKILSLETKHNFPIPTPAGPIPVNYIMDRLEQTGENEYKVVDYKSNRTPLTHEQLSGKLQARLYALAVQIAHKNATTIWVEFDYLRHSKIGVAFSKEDNAATWKMLKRQAARIVDTPDADAAKQETLNDECGWCVKKPTCKALQSNIGVGGIFALTDNDAARRYSEIKNQQRALRQLEGELETHLVKLLLGADTTVLDLEDATVKLTATPRRVLDHAQVPLVIGPDLTAELMPFTLGKIDALLKGNRIGAAQKALLENLIRSEYGEASLKVIPKK